MAILPDCQTGSDTTHRVFYPWQWISGQSIVVDEFYEMFMIAAACKDTVLVLEDVYTF